VTRADSQEHPSAFGPSVDVYVDTSALAKWYLNEDFSDEVEGFLQQILPAYISPLTKVEMKSLLARRRREGSLDAGHEARVFSVFEGDLISGHLVLLPLRAQHLLLAESILGAVPDIPLRTLDALHLGILEAESMTLLATADRVLARAAERRGLDCHTFF